MDRCIIIGVLFTGKGKVVEDERNPLFCFDGTPRVGRGLASSTFRKQYHALRTLHVHFQQDSTSKVAIAIIIVSVFTFLMCIER